MITQGSQNLNLNFYYYTKQYNLVTSHQSSQTTLMQLLSQLSNFFTAILTLYPQIPTSLHEQLKTMQAFLKSYDQKEFFLVQNFVRRLEAKAQKVRMMNKRKRHEMKTEPFDQENKENVFSIINVDRHGNSFGSASSMISNKFNDNLIMKVLKDNDKRFQQYIMKQLSHQSSHDNQQYLNIALNPQPNTSPQPTTNPSSSNMQQSLIHQLEFSKYHNSNQHDVTTSLSQIQQTFKEIRIDRVQAEDEVNTEGRKDMRIDKMRRNVITLRKIMNGNQSVALLENCIKTAFNCRNDEGNIGQRNLNEEIKQQPSKYQ